MDRKTVLEQAAACVTGKREQDYGTPEDNFKTIALFWNAYLDTNLITSKDVAMMMALLKIARARVDNPSYDCFVDIAGYAACGAEVLDKVTSCCTSEYAPVKESNSLNVGTFDV